MQIKNKAICPVCSSQKNKNLNYGGYEYKHKKFPLVKCDNCGLKYIVHNLSIQEINSFYDEDDYFVAEYGGGATKKYIENKEQQDKKAENMLKIIKKFKPKGRLLEIGSAGGFFLLKAQDDYGYDAIGLELSQKMCEYSRALGIKTYRGSINEIPEEIEKFDIVYMGDVLEHVSDPNDFISAVKRRLNKNGIIAFEVPLSYNITLAGVIIGIANIIKGRFGFKYFLPSQHRTLFIKKPPYHLLMFNNNSIKKFSEINNLKIKYLKIYDGYPNNKQRPPYYFLKAITSFITFIIKQTIFGDRAIVVSEI